MGLLVMMERALWVCGNDGNMHFRSRVVVGQMVGGEWLIGYRDLMIEPLKVID